MAKVVASGLWRDDSAAVISAELTLVLVIVVAATVLGLSRLRDVLTEKLSGVTEMVESLEQPGERREEALPARAEMVVIQADQAIVVCASALAPDPDDPLMAETRTMAER